MTTIPISEQFLSFQGEGPTAGRRAVFLRTHACNLFCGGGKYAAGARWTCDSIPVFTKIQKRYAPEELLAEWQGKGWLEALRAGAHLVITGGEPLMPQRQKELLPFLGLLNRCHPEAPQSGTEGSRDSSPAAQNDVPNDTCIEIETNGTFIPQPELHRHITHYNVSPKLSSSGMPREMRRIPEALRWHCDSNISIFKFVIASDGDAAEILSEFVNPFSIPPSRIWLMPAAATRADLLERGPGVARIAARHGWNFSTRLHILLYDQVTGV